MKLEFDTAQQSGSVGNDIDRRNKQWSVFFSLEDVPVLDYAGTPDSVLEGFHALHELSLDSAPVDEPSCSLPSVLLQTHNPVETTAPCQLPPWQYTDTVLFWQVGRGLPPTIDRTCRIVRSKAHIGHSNGPLHRARTGRVGMSLPFGWTQ